MSEIKQPKAYHDLKGCQNRISTLQGGTRSGKTYSTLQVLMEFAYTNKDQGLVISVVRKTFPSLRQTSYRDFIEILHNNGWYRPKEHNKSENTYNLFGNLFEYFAVDQAQKVRGSKRDILFINEANELDWDEFFQLNIRTKLKVVIDFNPSMEELHWIYQKLIIREDCGYYVSTYKDNPFLTKREIKEIESLKETDLHYWTVFGMGQRAKNPALVFQYKTIGVLPKSAVFRGYGMDFGFSNDPTTLVGLYQDGLDLYLDEVLYQTEMTNDDIDYFLYTNKINKFDKIVADPQDPKSIEDLQRRGWRMIKAKKGKDSIAHGIDLLKRHNIIITARSINIKKEFDLYKWKQYSDGSLSNRPVDMHNHSIDALRYIAEHSIRNQGKYIIS